MKKKLKKVLSLILFALLIFQQSNAVAFADEVSGSGESQPQIVIEVGSAEDFTTALETINNGEGNFTINITADITMASSINIKKNTVTIDGNNHTLDFGSLEQAIVVNGSSGASPTLILGKDANSTLTLKSNGQVRPDGSHFIIVGDSGALNGSGTLYMNTGVTVKDAYTNNTFGGGVLVGNGGKFVMNGGTITNCGIKGGSVCHGGGVAVICGGEFVMNGGTISYCSANSEGFDPDYGWSSAWATGGGVYVGLGSTFTMNDGTIDHNSASSNGGGVMVIESQDNYFNKGLGYLDSRFEMNGGTIQYNETYYIGGGLAVMGTTSIADGLCTATPSSGAPSNPGVYISGGSFIGNKASYGGGIVFYQIRGSIPMQIHKATITGNDAGYGGGVCVFGYWTNTDIDECTITDNTAGQGGGICMLTNGSGGNTTLKNSTITGNAADTKIGGGVYYDSNSKLTISGQNTIQNNTYNGVINNLNILDDSHPVYVNGSLSGSSIGLSDPTLWNDNLADSDSTAVSTAKLTSGFKENNDGINPEDVFTSDHNTWVPDYGEKKEDTTSLGYDYSNEVRLVREYTIKYKDGDSDAYFGSIVYPTTYRNEKVTLVDPAEKTGYKFMGWYRDSDCTNGPVTELGTNETIDENGNIVLYAKWAQVIHSDDTAKESSEETKVTVTTVTAKAQATENSQNSQNNNGSATIPQTGDNSNIALWFAMLLLSGGALTVLTVARKKEKSKR